jgi:hypothetical protein
VMVFPAILNVLVAIWLIIYGIVAIAQYFHWF